MTIYYWPNNGGAAAWMEVPPPSIDIGVKRGDCRGHGSDSDRAKREHSIYCLSSEKGKT